MVFVKRFSNPMTSANDALDAVFSAPVMLQERSFTARKVYNRLFRRHSAGKGMGKFVDIVHDIETAMDYMSERQSMAQDVRWYTGFRYQSNELILFFRFNRGAVRLDLSSVSMSTVQVVLEETPDESFDGWECAEGDWLQAQQLADELRKEVDAY